MKTTNIFENFYSGFQADPAGKYELKVKGPALYLVGPYKISGRVLVLPIQGVGISNTTLGQYWMISNLNSQFFFIVMAPIFFYILQSNLI